MSFIILDRDGVINFDSEHYIKSPDEWIAIPGSLAAIAQLNRAGFKVLIASNQSGLARHLFDHAQLSAMHKKFLDELAAYGGHIEEIFYCPHHPHDQCACRKPKVGMFLEMQKKYPINFSTTYFIGDSWTDALAASAIGCKFLLVATGKGESTLAEHQELAGNFFPDLAHAAQHVLGLTNDST